MTVMYISHIIPHKRAIFDRSRQKGMSIKRKKNNNKKKEEKERKSDHYTPEREAGGPNIIPINTPNMQF